MRIATYCRHACSLVMAFALLLPAAQAGKESPRIQDKTRGASQEQNSALEELDVETRRQLDALTPQSSSAGQAQARAARDRTKAERLARINRRPLTPKQLKAHVDALQGRLSKALSADALERARLVEAALPKGQEHAKGLRASANGLAVAGFWPEATWLTAKLAQDTGDATDLNNLAAFLTMQGAASPALPILHTLNARYPENSTLLNNLGQAYQQLGASDEAERYLASAVRITPMHPQANATRATIQQANGDKSGAQASLQKALDGGYAPSKVDQLRKAGGKWRATMRNWHLPMPQDPLGLGKFVLPEFPLDPKSLPNAASTWARFREALRERKENLEARRTSLMARLQGPEHQRKVVEGLSKLPFAAVAMEVSRANNTEFSQHLTRATQELAAVLAREATRRNALITAIEAMQEKNDRIYSKDTAAAEAHRCDGVPQAYESYLRASNPELESTQSAYLEWRRKVNNERAYMAQFISPTPEDFEVAKLGEQVDYLQALLNTKVALAELTESDKPKCLTRPRTKSDGELQDFDEIHCQYISEFDMGMLGGMTFRCNTSEAHFNPSFAPFEFAWKIRSTGKSDEWQWVSASAAVEVKGIKVAGHGEFDDQGLKSGGVSVEGSTDIGPKIKGGPLEIGVEATGRIGIEMDRGGVTDIIVSAGVESKGSSTVVKTDQGGQMKSTAKTGIDSNWSWNAGASASASTGFNSNVFNL